MATAVLSPHVERASRKMIFLLDKYKEAHPNEPLPLDPAKAAIWAYENDLWVPIDVDPREILRRKMCRALRHQYITDPQGREVRANYAAVVEVETSEGPRRKSQFYPIFKTPPEVVRQALALDRKQVLNIAFQMKLDFDSYNENNEFNAMLEPLDLNLNKDIEEMSLSTDYDPDPYGDSEDSDED